MGRALAAVRDITVSTGSVTGGRHSAYQLAGDGVPVVLLHGFLGRPGDMDSLCQAAVKAGLPVIAPTYKPTCPIRFAEERLLSSLERAGRPCHVVGHSLGGLIAVLAAGIQPELFASLVTVASPLGGAPLAALPIVRRLTLGEVVPKAATYDRLVLPLVPLLSIAARFDALVPVNSALALSGSSLIVPEGHMSVLANEDMVHAVSAFWETTGNALH